METCHNIHRYDHRFQELPESQSQPNRHHCAGCAFELGVKLGKKFKPVPDNLSDLPISQAGTVRHKDARVALMQGYLLGIGQRSTRRGG